MLSQWTQPTGHRRGISSSSKTNILICFKRKIQFYTQSELQLFTTKLRVKRCFKQKETTLSSIQKQAPNFTKVDKKHCLSGTTEFQKGSIILLMIVPVSLKVVF